MTFTPDWLWAILCVFVRASGMFLSSPIFGAQHTPVQIRVLTALSIAAALTALVKPKIGPVPVDLYSLAVSVGNEAVAGLLIGTIISLVFYAVQIAGSLVDLQIGLGSSQVMNPATGVPITVISQFKFMLATVVFLSINGHHTMFHAFVQSYTEFPVFSVTSMDALQGNLVKLLGDMSLLAFQIAAPVAAVGAIVDAGLGIVNKAVPQMQVFMVGMPAKILLGLAALSLAMPTVVAGVDAGVRHSLNTLWKTYQSQSMTEPPGVNGG